MIKIGPVKRAKSRAKSPYPCIAHKIFDQDPNLDRFLYVLILQMVVIRCGWLVGLSNFEKFIIANDGTNWFAELQCLKTY